MHEASRHFEDGATDWQPCCHLTDSQAERPNIAETIDDVAKEEGDRASACQGDANTNEKTDTDSAANGLESVSVSRRPKQKRYLP